MEQLKEGWRKMHTENFHNVKSPENTNVAKSSFFRWVLNYSTDWGNEKFVQNFRPKFWSWISTS
jgi:hypothetical protein